MNICRLPECEAFNSLVYFAKNIVVLVVTFICLFVTETLTGFVACYPCTLLKLVFQ